jgi:hypothetical protein
MRKCTVGPTPGVLVLSLLLGCGGRAGSEGDAGADE